MTSAEGLVYEDDLFVWAHLASEIDQGLVTLIYEFESESEVGPVQIRSSRLFFIFSCSKCTSSSLACSRQPLTLLITLMRPRPPVRNTLSSSYTKPSPPPPYGDALTSPEASTPSESGTAHRIRALAKDVFSGAVPSAIEEWINGQSREELSSLLVRANELIRERERGKSSTPMPFLDTN
jgi:hypothetical protein